MNRADLRVADLSLFQFMREALLGEGQPTRAAIIDRALDLAAETGEHYEDARRCRQGEPLDLYDLEILKLATLDALAFAGGAQ